MGFTPNQVDEMSLWTFAAASEGYVLAHSPEGSEGLTDSEKDALWDFIQQD